MLIAFSPASSSPPLHIWPRTGLISTFTIQEHFLIQNLTWRKVGQFMVELLIAGSPLSRTAKRQWFDGCVSRSPAFSVVMRTTPTELLVTPGIRLCIEQSTYRRAPAILNWSFCTRQAEKAETVAVLQLAYFPYSLYVLLNCTKSLPKLAWTLLGIPCLCNGDCSGREFLSKLVVLSRHVPSSMCVMSRSFCRSLWPLIPTSIGNANTHIPSPPCQECCSVVSQNKHRPWQSRNRVQVSRTLVWFHKDCFHAEIQLWFSESISAKPRITVLLHWEVKSRVRLWISCVFSSRPMCKI